MNNSSQSLSGFALCSKVAILLAISAIWVLSADSAIAQQESAGGQPTQSNAAAAVPPAVPAEVADKAPARVQPTAPVSDKVGTPAGDYKSSLEALSNLYQNQIQQLGKKNAQAKALFTDGLISRVEMEAGDKALADARAMVEDVARQIAAANKPASPVNDPATMVASNQAWSTGNSRIDGLIRYYGNQHGVDPYLIYCLMAQESKFTSGATSPKGAQGLMQLMPGTAARYGVTNPYDVAQNISGGTRYLKDLLKMFNGRVDLALAGYNAGEGAVMKYGYTIPPYNETQNYVKLIIKRYAKKQAS
jgi:soluble lytic murein transglycosylase-like protein